MKALNTVQVKVKLRSSIGPDAVFHSIFLAVEGRTVPTQAEVISAVKNQIDFYAEQGINPQECIDEIELLKAISEAGTPEAMASQRQPARSWFSPFDNHNMTMFLSGDYIIVALIHLVWHGNQAMGSVTGQTFTGKN